MFRFLCLIVLIVLNISAFSQINDAELTYQETNIVLLNGKLYKSITNEIKIFNRAGEEFTKVSIPYSKLIKISKLEACIKDMNGIIIKRLGKGEISDRNAISDMAFYEDNFVKEFTLKHNVYPYSIFYSYQLQQDEFLQIEEWLPVIGRKVPTIKAVLNVEVPLDYNILFTNRFTDTFRSDTTNSFFRYSWTASCQNLPEKELFSPPFSSLIPDVSLVPLKFRYDKPGSFDTWISFGDWNNSLLEGLSDLPILEKSKVLNMVRDVEGFQLQRIKILYYYLQDQTRYINVTLETGGFKPYPASYVAKNKYGDCKALTNYFMAVLEVAGIKSFYTKVNADDPKIQIDKSFPSQQFNHIILCVPLQGDTIWLDCTSNNPFNYLGIFTQDRDVLILEKGRSHFTKTPALSYSDVREMRKAKIRQNYQDQVLAAFSNSSRGEAYEALIYLSHSVSESQRSQIFKSNFGEEGFDVIDFNLKDPERDSAEIYHTYTARSNDVYKFYGDDLLIKILPFQVLRFEDPGKRRLPVQIDYPIFKIDSLEYEIPAGYSLNGDLINKEIRSNYGIYKVEAAEHNRIVKIVKEFYPLSGKL